MRRTHQNALCFCQLRQLCRTVSLRTAVSVSGKRIFEGRDKEPASASKVLEGRCGHKISLNNPAHSGLFGET